MEHGDPLLWWRLEPQARAAAVGYLGAVGAERLEAERKTKRRKGAHPGPFMGIRGLETEHR